MKSVLPLFACLILLAACDSSEMDTDEQAILLAPTNWGVWSSDSAMVLRWAPIEGARYYKVEVADDPVFAVIVDSVETTETQATVKPRQLGPHWWRVVTYTWGDVGTPSIPWAYRTEDRSYFRAELSYEFEFDPARFSGFESVGLSAPEDSLDAVLARRGLTREQVKWIWPRRVTASWEGHAEAPTAFGDLEMLVRSEGESWVRVASVSRAVANGHEMSISADTLLFTGGELRGLLRIAPRENQPATGTQRIRVTVGADVMAVVHAAPPPPP